MRNFIFRALLLLSVLPSQVLASPCAELLLGVDPISEFIRLEGEELKRYPTLKWIMERMERHNASVSFAGDQVFHGECARAGAFVHCSSIVVQINLLKEVLAGQRDDLMAHEFHHIGNSRRCEWYGDCLRLIEFVSNEVNLYTGRPFNETLTPQGFESYKTIYGKYFRSDEVEAYYISSRFSQDVRKKVENLRVSIHFATQQIYYMTLALERLRSGIVLQLGHSSIVVPIVHREKSINVRLKRVDLPMEQAVEVYSEQLKKRIGQLKNLKKRLRKELLESKGGF